MSNSSNRKATHRITMRFTPAEHELLRSAVAKQPDPWRGVSHHLRQVLLAWAVPVESKRRARSKPVRKSKASSPPPANGAAS